MMKPLSISNHLYPKSLTKRDKGAGIIIMEDYFAPNSRENFICLAMEKLNSKAMLKQDAFRTSFFKSMLAFRDSINYIDVRYYLLFSALEALCRFIKNDYSLPKHHK